MSPTCPVPSGLPIPVAPTLALLLPRGSRARLAQGLWLLSWLLALADGLELLGAAYLLAQALRTFLAQSCHFPAAGRHHSAGN